MNKKQKKTIDRSVGYFLCIFLRIPVFIHESDCAPGRVNKWAGKFADRIALSYKEAAEYFPKGKVAYTGQPVLEEKLTPIENGAGDQRQATGSFTDELKDS